MLFYQGLENTCRQKT